MLHGTGRSLALKNSAAAPCRWAYDNAPAAEAECRACRSHHAANCGSGDFGKSPFYGQLTEQATGLPALDYVACRTRSTIAGRAINAARHDFVERSRALPEGRHGYPFDRRCRQPRRPQRKSPVMRGSVRTRIHHNDHGQSARVRGRPRAGDRCGSGPVSVSLSRSRARVCIGLLTSRYCSLPPASPPMRIRTSEWLAKALPQKRRPTEVSGSRASLAPRKDARFGCERFHGIDALAHLLLLESPWDAVNFDVYTIRPDGPDLLRLSASRASDGHAVWTTDGRIMWNSGIYGFRDEAMSAPHSGRWLRRDVPFSGNRAGRRAPRSYSHTSVRKSGSVPALNL
jgi:hypothetical protein